MSNFNIFGVYVANSLPPGKHSILIQDLAPTFDSIVSTVSGVFDSFSRSHLHIHPPKGEICGPTGVEEGGGENGTEDGAE